MVRAHARSCGETPMTRCGATRSGTTRLRRTRWFSALVGAVILAVPVGAAAQLAEFFRCPVIAYFGSCPDRATAQGPPVAARAPGASGAATKPSVEEQLWAEPVTGADGQARVYVPPRAVREFLDNPTAENARAYLQWNRERISRVERANAVMMETLAADGSSRPTPLSSVKGGAIASPAGETAPVSGPAIGGRSPISIVYAFATWCPYSRQTTPAIDRLAEHVAIRGVAFDSSPADVGAVAAQVRFPVQLGAPSLRSTLGVTSYPTLLFYDGADLIHTAKGQHTLEQLLKTLAALSSDARTLPAAALAAGACQVSP